MNYKFDRRLFLSRSLYAGCAASLSSTLLINQNQSWAATAPPLTKTVSNHEALHYEQLDALKVQCKLCPKECRVADGERGYCGVRENVNGSYQTLVYGRPCSLHVDPIEKKPLFHYLPTSRAFSLATAGCNIECKFCQNWDISQFRPEQINMFDLDPNATAALAKETQSQTIAYTYSEPVIFYEYMLDTAKAARKQGIGSVMISNGYIQEKPMRELLPHLTGVKIDFKAFTETFYDETCNGELKPVLETLKVIKEVGTWLELVILIIPTLNDSDDENKQMAEWIVENLGQDVPIHLTRFHPTYKIKNLTSTPVKTLERLRDIARDAGLNYVYIGNVPGHPSENTVCPKCDEILIRRIGFRTTVVGLSGGKCKHCGNAIPGVWSDPLAETT